MTLAADELRRYGRHIALPEVGLEGQRRLKAAKVLCVGVGGLGSPAALYLAAAGVGTIGLVDADVVEVSNLQRQILYSAGQAGAPKAAAARERLLSLNPGVRVEVFPVRLTASNALSVLKDYDIVLDGADNFPTRFLVNDACVRLGMPDVQGSVSRFDGQLSVFWAARGPCYRCLQAAPPPAGLLPDCAEGGVLGVLPGVIGTLQALEAIKLVLDLGEPLIGRVLHFDALRLETRTFKLDRRPDCPGCGKGAAASSLVDEEWVCYNERMEIQMKETLFTKLYKAVHGVQGAPSVSVEDLKAMLDAKEEVLLLDVRTPGEHEIAHLPGSTLIPMNDIPTKASGLDKDKPTIVYCHTGGRSARVTAFLRKAGFEKALNLEGGIDAWAERIDPSMPRY